MKNNKKIIILFIVFLIAGIALGIVIDAKILCKKDVKEEINENNYGEKIKQSSYSSEDLNKKIDKINSLYQKLNDLKSQVIDVESEIGILQNEVNNATNFQFEDDIYQNNDENIVEDDNDLIEDNTDQQSNSENEIIENELITEPIETSTSNEVEM